METPPYGKTSGWDLFQGIMMSIVGAEDPPVQDLLRCSGRDLPVEGGFCWFVPSLPAPGISSSLLQIGNHLLRFVFMRKNTMSSSKRVPQIQKWRSKSRQSRRKSKLRTNIDQHVPNSNFKIPEMRNQSSPKPFFWVKTQDIFVESYV